MQNKPPKQENNIISMARRVAKGGNGGNFPPNTESCTKYFQVNQAFDV